MSHSNHWMLMQMIQRPTPCWFGSVLCAAAIAVVFNPFDGSAWAQQAPVERVLVKVTCGSHSVKSVEPRSFQSDLQFDVIGTLWMVDRPAEPPPGKEKFRGILASSGAMLIVGEGQADDGSTWTYEFAGQKKPKNITILQGSLRTTTPKGSRSCSLTF
jgi:hypothetical protein